MLDTLQQEYEQQLDCSSFDSLTRLHNRGCFHFCLEREVERSSRYGTPFVLVILDIDNFHEYNRNKGVIAGDRALQNIGSIIQNQCIRSSDLAARFESDTFALLLIETTVDQAMDIVTRLCDSVRQQVDDELRLSAGMISCPTDRVSCEALLDGAKSALFRAREKVGSPKICPYQEHGSTTAHDSEPEGTVLVVDDEPRNVKLFEALLQPLGYRILKAYRGKDALQLVQKEDIDCILLDIMMPELDGYEVCSLLKSREATRLIPIIMVTALDSSEAKLASIEAGADDFITKPPNKLELITRTKSLIRQKKLNNNLTSIEQVLCALANVVEAKDSYTEGHVQRVSSLAVAMGKRLALPPSSLHALHIGGILHDIGKIAIPAAILNKRDRLTDEEWQNLMRHPVIGHSICLPMKNTLREALDIVRHHHEKLDGSGYPDGLQAKAISLPVRIMAVVDIYDALSTDRPYRKALPRMRCLELINQECAGGKLDPVVVAQLNELLEKGEQHLAPPPTRQD